VSVDPLAAEGFGSGAAAYERARPGYPAEAVEFVCAAFALDSTSRVVDVGAGTGKLTRAFLERVGSVVAVEPLDGMRAELERLLPGVDAVAGFAESLPLADASVAAVVSGEAFHWFDLEPALAEFRRVLLRGGGLAVFWNVPHWEGDWVQPFSEAVDRRRDSRVHPFTGRRPWTFDERMHDRTDWEPIRSASFEHDQDTTRAGLLEIASSWSFIAALPDDERAAALAEIDSVLAEHGVQDVVLGWRCDVHVTRPVTTS
jgi:SAM-dependent methyltransferase